MHFAPVSTTNPPAVRGCYSNSNETKKTAREQQQDCAFVETREPEGKARAPLG